MLGLETCGFVIMLLVDDEFWLLILLLLLLLLVLLLLNSLVKDSDVDDSERLKLVGSEGLEALKDLEHNGRI